MAWGGTVQPFRFRPSWQAIMDLPWDAQKAKLLDPAFKAQLLSEENDFSGAPQDIMGLLMVVAGGWGMRSEEHTSELQSLMRISYAVFCLKKKNKKTRQ